MALLWVCFTGGKYHHCCSLALLTFNYSVFLFVLPEKSLSVPQNRPWNAGGKLRQKRMQRKLSLCSALPVLERGCDSCMSTLVPFSCAALFQVKLFLFQTFTQLLTSVANGKSTCNLTLSLVQAITGCFFFTWMNVIIEFLAVTLYFSVKFGSKQWRSSINSNGCRKAQTHDKRHLVSYKMQA